MPLDLTQLSQITEPLLAWYEKNARVLPWRENTDAYRVWVSEIMLQQTRVEAVKEYYRTFLQELPTIEALAEVDDDRLMKLWEGLGYYNRARNLKKAAGEVVIEWQGNFPAEYDEILSLPGIGEYTAGAIGSICFDLPTPAVDGNVLRVYTRVMENRQAGSKEENPGGTSAGVPVWTLRYADTESDGGWSNNLSAKWCAKM